jgi:hypothetical protein
MHFSDLASTHNTRYTAASASAGVPRGSSSALISASMYYTSHGIRAVPRSSARASAALLSGVMGASSNSGMLAISAMYSASSGANSMRRV